MSYDSISPPRFLVITYPRTASNLLFRILGVEHQPNVQLRAQDGGYFFYNAQLHKFLNGLNEKPISQWTPDERQKVREVHQDCMNDMLGHLNEAAANGKIVFVKEHSNFLREPVSTSQFIFGGEEHVSEPAWRVSVPNEHSPDTASEPHASLNETVYPDPFLRTWRLIFLIRHPALSYPSFLRALVDIAGLEVATKSNSEMIIGISLHWTRALYNWAIADREISKAQSNASGGEKKDGEEEQSKWPLIVDADQILQDPSVARHICDLTGLDASKIQTEWSHSSEEEEGKKDRIMKRMLSSLATSTGVQRDKMAGDAVDVEVEAKKWREEFGEEMGRKLERFVREAIPDYEYMRARRVVVPRSD